jgi:hypothetical protein
MAGYSSSPLVKKLGIRTGMRLWIVDPPRDYVSLVEGLPVNLEFTRAENVPVDFIHAFYKKAALLSAEFQALKARLIPNGMLWISWPKRSSGIETDLNENLVREIGLRGGLVDVKVCAVDESWSGLKFVYRLKDRS